MYATAFYISSQTYQLQEEAWSQRAFLKGPRLSRLKLLWQNNFCANAHRQEPTKGHNHIFSLLIRVNLTLFHFTVWPLTISLRVTMKDVHLRDCVSFSSEPALTISMTQAYSVKPVLRALRPSPLGASTIPPGSAHFCCVNSSSTSLFLHAFQNHKQAINAKAGAVRHFTVLWSDQDKGKQGMHWRSSIHFYS